MATAITTSEAEVPLDLLPRAENDGDPTGEDLIGYSDDEFAELSEEHVVSSKAGLLDLPGAADMTGPHTELGVDLAESPPHVAPAGINDDHGVDVLDDGNAWDLLADVDATFEEKVPQDADLKLGAEAVSAISATADHLDNEYGNEDFTETHQNEDTAASTALLDRGADPDFDQGDSVMPLPIDENQAEDALHEIDYDEDGQTESHGTGSLNPQALEDEAVDHDDTVSQDILNPFTGAEAVDDARSNYQKDDQETDPSRMDSRSMQDRALDEALYGDSSAASLDTPMDGGDLPEVIVCWHGVDYPLLYDSPGSEGKQCFFEDANLLHCAMEELLSNFRRELSDDLSPTDELVLQVNEMGLEFAESSNSDNFRDITLDSILQVFNDLVRNKDPDAARPLYAYLITRPSCSSRWQALIEDAYQGKNIDEVSICFPGGQHATSAINEFPDEDESEDQRESDEEDQGMGSSEDADGNAEKPLQDETGPGDDDADLVDDEPFNQELEEYVVAEDSGAEVGHDVPDRDNFEPQTAYSQEAVSTAVQVESMDQPDRSEGVVEDQNDMIEGDDDVGTGDNALLEGELEGEGEGDVEEEHDMRSPLQDAVGGSETHEVYLVTETDTANVEVNGPSPSDKQAAFDADEADETKVTSDTSATATLDGDEHGDTFNGDFDFDANIGQGLEDTDTALIEETAGDLDEIDWRDYADQGDEAVAQDSAVASVKRPRSDEDDIVDAEHEQDVKRRRSDA